MYWDLKMVFRGNETENQNWNQNVNFLTPSDPLPRKSFFGGTPSFVIRFKKKKKKKVKMLRRSHCIKCGAAQQFETSLFFDPCIAHLYLQ